MSARLRGLRLYDLAEFYEQVWAKVPVFHLRDGWFMSAPGFALLHRSISLKLKRVLDVLVAMCLLLLLLPVGAIVALAIRLETKGPVIYRQQRVGAYDRPFQVYKFRSMVADAESGGARWASGDDQRITAVGRILRKLRIDEWPQMWNVIKGDMSFIGPRPERPEFTETLEREIPYYDLRHLVKPGITGWAQVMYPYGSSVEDAIRKLEYDLYYIKNHSLMLDLLIFLKTIRVVLFGKGV